MADEENIEEQEITVPEMWQLVKPVNPDEDDEDVRKPQPPPKIGKLVKMLNDIEDPEELDAKVQEVDPATGQSLLMWATLNKKFVLVEWLVKKCKRNAFAFVQGPDNQIAIFDKWVEIRKEIAEREKEKAAQAAQAQEEEAEDEEEKEPEPKPEQLVYDALGEYQDDWGKRGLGLVKLIGELGVYQGSRDAEFTKEGEGRTLYPNGDMYCGQYRNNQRDGLGTYYFASSGMLYTGQWSNNIREGVGRMVYPDGGRYFGSWARDKQNGEGHYTYPDGSSYAGAWEEGIKNGFGTYTFTDGSQYIGAFVDGEFVSGEWRMAQGSTRYYGAFKNDIPFGAGVYIFKYGSEGSFRQEGTYTNGKWSPIGAVKGVHATPQLRLIIQQREFSLTFTEECGSLHMEHLVFVNNFAPFIRWVRSLNQNTRDVILDSVQVSSIKLHDEGSSLREVKLKVVARDGTGKRIRNTDAITLSEPITKLMVILSGGDKTVCLLKKAPNASQALNEQLSLPTVRTTADGSFLGEFVRIVEPAVRIRLHKSVTKSILTNVLSDPQFENSQQDVVAYVQHIHADAMAKLQQRLEEASGTSGFGCIVPIRLGDVASMSSDAITVAAALRVQTLVAEGKLPTATVEAQRPPTPLPPSAEPRPDIEPLLEAERRALAAKKAAAEDE